MIPFIALLLRGVDKPETWTVAAAALAVITSVVSTWSSRRVLEIQEDAQKPNPTPAFDFGSRYGLAMLRVKNAGGSPAHDVILEWDTDLIDHHKKKIGFCKTEDFSGIAVLLPGESITQIIDVPHEFMSRLPPKEYTGQVLFCDVSGRSFRKPFRLSARQYMNTPMDHDEWAKTLYEAQKIPQELSKIRRVIEKSLD